MRIAMVHFGRGAVGICQVSSRKKGVFVPITPPSQQWLSFKAVYIYHFFVNMPFIVHLIVQ